MLTQPTLPAAPRLHDLPPLWDGHRVKWRGWRAAMRSSADFHIRQPEVCNFCADPTPASSNVGVVYASMAGLLRFPRRTSPTQRVEEATLGRPVQWLTAYRCPSCRRDQVEDRVTGELWDLDDPDYGDDGSWAF